MNAEQNAALDSICDSVEQMWLKAIEPNLAGIMHSADVNIRVALAQQLMLIDAEYRRKKFGRAPLVEEYAAKLNVDVQHLWAAADTFTKAAAEDTATFIGQPAEDDATFIGQPEAEGQSQSDWDAPVLPPQPKQQPLFAIRGYEILAELGRGGMGVVYKARQLRPGRLVAIKTIHAPQLASKEVLLRFQAEAEAAGRLDHRSIVPVYEVGEDNGVHFFSMGFVDGTDLEKKAREQVLSCREAAEICRDIAEALEYAHQNGVIHRDIKPQNILIGSDGKPRITDFGLAKLSNQDAELTGSGQIMGTAAYMPPEQATGKTSEAGPTADVYALGATLYRCVTGRPPFQAASAMEILRQVVDDEPIPPRRLNREIDEDIETLCLKCLEKNPAGRFDSAGELAAELTRYLNHEPILSRPIGNVTRVWRWCQRRPFVAASIVLTVALVAAITIGIQYLVLQQTQLALARSDQQIQALKLKEQERATDQANQFAATQEYYATVREVREQRVKPTPGWTWNALDLLQKAAELPTAGKDLVELRSLIAETMTTPDLREVGRMQGDRALGSIALSRDKRFVAIGDWAGVPTSNLRIFELSHTPDPETALSLEFRPHRICSLNTLGDKAKAELNRLFQGFGSSGKKIEREGIHAAAFSPDGRYVTVGTRNGRLVCWNIEPETPVEVFNVLPEKAVVDGMHKVAYSPDGSVIYAHWHKMGGNSAFLAFEAMTGKTMFSTGEDSWDFTLLTDGRVILSEGDVAHRFRGVDTNGSVDLKVPASLVDARLQAAPDLFLMLANREQTTFVDTTTGLAGLSLDTGTSGVDEMSFFPDTGLICGHSNNPHRLILWDGLNGNRVHERAIAGGESPRIVADIDAGYLFITDDTSIGAFEVRSPIRASANAAGADFLSITSMPQSVIAPGAHPILGFDLSSDGSHVVILELAGESERTRVRKINTSSGVEIQRWVCAALARPFKNIFGADVAFLGVGEKTAVAASIPGNVVVASANGFEVPSGLGIDVVHWASESVEKQVATWHPPENLSKDREVGVAVALYFPRALNQSQEILEFKLTTHMGDYLCSANDQFIESQGWFLLSLGGLKSEELSHPWSLTCTLTANNLSLKQFVPEISTNRSDTDVEVGDVYLFPSAALGEKELLLGPLSGRGDGGLSCTVRKAWLHQWNSDLSNQTAKPWQDFINNQEDVGAIAAAEHQTLVGSDSGLVVLLDQDGNRRLLQEGEKASTNSEDRISAAAISRDGHFGAAGTFGGRLFSYDLHSPRNAPAFSTNAHTRTMTAISLTDDGKLVATAAEDGSLRIWKRLPESLELFFEMTNDTTPIVEMRLSSNGEFLYLLRQGERGIRRLEIARLMTLFKVHGL